MLSSTSVFKVDECHKVIPPASKSLEEFPVASCLWGASLVAQQYRIRLPMQEMLLQYLGLEDSLKEEMQPTAVFLP